MDTLLLHYNTLVLSNNYYIICHINTVCPLFANSCASLLHQMLWLWEATVDITKMLLAEHKSVLTIKNKIKRAKILRACIISGSTTLANWTNQPYQSHSPPVNLLMMSVMQSADGSWSLAPGFQKTMRFVKYLRDASPQPCNRIVCGPPVGCRLFNTNQKGLWSNYTFV